MRVVVVGAGLAGLTAGRSLRDAGHDVILFDKGRGPGGRMATRRIGTATLDHGAQFFTARSDVFAAQVATWVRGGLVFEWCRGFMSGDGSIDGHPRYAVHGGMNALAKHLAAGLDVRCSTLVFAIRRGAARGWSVALDDGSAIDTDAVVVTCPVPQAFSLLVSAEVEVPETLWRTPYDRTLALLAVLDRASAVPPPGGVQNAAGLSFVGDNQAKGISATPALTLHADAAWSDAHWDDEPDSAAALLRDAAESWLGDARIVEWQLKRWRFATPRTIWPEACWRPAGDGAAITSLVMAGDAFAGPRVEGAVLSGLAAASALLGRD